LSLGLLHGKSAAGQRRLGLVHIPHCGQTRSPAILCSFQIGPGILQTLAVNLHHRLQTQHLIVGLFHLQDHILQGLVLGQLCGNEFELALLKRPAARAEIPQQITQADAGPVTRLDIRRLA
jgi:hypothetical protein